MHNAKQLLVFDIDEDQEQQAYSPQDKSPAKQQKQTDISQKHVPVRSRRIKVKSKEDQQSNKQQSDSNIVFYQDDSQSMRSSVHLEGTERELISKEDRQNKQYLSQEMEEDIRMEKRNREIKIPKTFILQSEVDNLIHVQVLPNFKISCIIVVESRIMGLSSKYSLYLKENKELLLSSKKAMLSVNSCFLISKNKELISKRDKSYVGRVESNFYGTQFKLINPYHQIQKQNLFIKYDKSFMGSVGVRNFKVCKVNPKLKKKHLMQNFLMNLLQKGEMSKVIQMETTKPKLNKGKYKIDFAGKAKIPSSKNFILECNQKQSILFAKQTDNCYLLEVSHPFSILDAFAICLASLDFKILAN